MEYDIKDLRLASAGVKRIEWAARWMPVLASIKRRFERERPLRGIRIGACLHVTSETAQLIATLKAGGAEVQLCASNPLSTQDDVAAALVEELKVPVFAIKGEDRDRYYEHLHACLGHNPQITLDDGADLTSTLHQEHPSLAEKVLGGTEETTTGVVRLRNLERSGKLRYPVMAVNESYTKYLFDNRYGTGQSTIDGILRATNLLIAGSTVVVCGYGWCGRGVAMRARGMGADVIVTEVDPIRALEARMDGFRVMPIREAAPQGDLFITVTGNLGVIGRQELEKLKDGAVICNAGHFDVEIDIKALEKLSRRARAIREFCTEYELKDGRRIYLLAEGRLVNLAAAEGHPAMVMDLSFSNQALAAEYLKKNAGKLKPKVYELPRELDEELARLKLCSMGIKIDLLSPHQRRYLEAWRTGT